MLVERFGKLLAAPLLFVLTLLASSLAIATPAAAVDCTLPTVTFTALNQSIVLDAKPCDPIIPGVGYYAGIHFQGEEVASYYGIGWSTVAPGPRLDTAVGVATGSSLAANYTFTGVQANGEVSDNTFTVRLDSLANGAGNSDTITVYTCKNWDGGSSCGAQDKVIIPVNLHIPPTVQNYTATAVAYNAPASNINLSGQATGNPTSFAVGSTTTSGGGSVTINAAGLATYTPATSFRGNDTFTYTATNGYGTSASRTVTVPVNNPTFSVTLPSATGNVGVAYNTAATPVMMSGGAAPYSNFSATGLPTGLSMNASGVISGTPTAATTATVSVTATDSSNTPYTNTSAPATATLTIASVPAPTVTGISPSVGPAAGGTIVTITGTNLLNASAVSFGGSAGTSVVVNSATQITVTSPAGANTVDVRVTTPGGQSAISAADEFTYIPAPTVTAVSPNAGPTSGTNSVTITGTNLSGATAVTFGATAATGYTVISPTQITATVPAGSATTINVRVTTGGGTSGLAVGNQYTYVAAPTVTTISQNAGPLAGGTTVVITGTGFSDAPGTGAVKFGAANATYTINSNTQITATSPANAAGPYNVTVTTPGGASATSASNEFTYVAAPTVTSLSPTTGSTNGAQTVVITGTNLLNATSVVFGAAPATGYVINSATQITATSPANSAGPANVRVTTVGGQSATGAGNQYTYVAPPIGSSQPYGSIIAYNDGSNLTTNIDLSLYVSGGTPTSYAVGSATTAQGGSVSVDSSGQATYTPPVGYRNGTDSFTYTATNVGGTSAPATVTVTIGNPTILLTLPANSGTVGVAYNGGSTAVSFEGGRATYTVNSINGLPPGLTPAGGGIITGTPTTAGNYTVTVNVTDSSLGAGPYNANTTALLTIAAPTITLSPASGALPGAQAGVGYSQTITSTGGIAPISYGVTGTLPPGMTLSSGTISGTPTSTGTYNFTVTGTDASGNSYTGTANYSITVSAPTITVSTASLISGTVAAPYNPGATQNVTATGGNAPHNFTIDTGTLPAGMTLTTGGVLSGTPTQGGTFPITIRATDSTAGGTYFGTQAYNLVIAAPTITLSPNGVLSNATIGASYNATITALGGTGAHTFAVAAGDTLPDGLTLSTSGALSGTPTQAGAFTFTVEASDSSTGGGTGAGGRYVGTQVYNLIVAPPTITLSPASPLPNAAIATPYTGVAITASGGTAGYTFTHTALPAGLTMSSSGVFSGTPTAGGAFSFDVTAEDSSTGTGAPFTKTVTYQLTVTVPTITVSPTTLAPVAAGAPINVALSATGGTSGYTYSLSGNVPPGVSVSGNTLTGVATAAGSFNLTISAQDSSTGSGPYTGDRTYTWVINPPVITLSPTSLGAGQVGAAYSQSVSASGGTAPYTYTASAGLPAGLTLSTGGVLSGTPTAAGTFNFSIDAQDSTTGGSGFSGSQNYTVTIGAPTLVVSPTGLTGMKAGVPYTATITSTGGTAPYSFSVTSGALPAGLTLASDGVISGTPTASGAANFTITAQDASTGTGAPFTLGRPYAVNVDSPSLVVAPATVPAGIQHSAYAETITTTGGTAPYTYTVSAGALPTGLTLSTAGQLSGTPTVVGTFNFTVQTKDSTTGGAFTQTQGYSLVINVPAPPTPGAVSLTVAANSSANVVTPVLSGVPATSVAVGAAPSHGTAVVNGMAFDYTPTAGFSGTDTFTYTASNAGGASAPATVTITVTKPTLVVSGTPGDGIVATAYPGATFTASTGTAPYTFAGASLPTGLVINATTGVLSGTPTAAGTFTAVITATDAYGAEGTASFPINILAPLVTLTSPAAGSLPTATAYVSYSQTFTATGGATPPSFSVTAGALPPGLTLSASGVLSGQATTVGTYNFSITPSDGSAAPGPYPGAPVSYSLVVIAPTLTLGPNSLPAADYGVDYSRTFQAAGGVAPYSYSSTGALPTGVTLNASTGVLSGTPMEEGSFPLTVTATDSAGGSGPFSVSVNVTLTVNRAPVPVVEPTSTTTPAGSSKQIDVSSLIDGFYDTVVIVDPPQHGTAVVNGGAARMRSQSGGSVTITYTPNPGYYGPDTFTYAATGPGGTSAPAAIAVAVAAPAPVVVDDAASVAANASVGIAVTTNDTGPIATIAVATAPSHGTAMVSGLSINYVPAANFFGTDTFTYTATGEGGTGGPATVTVTVTPLAVPAQTAQTITVLAGQSVTLAATQGATGGPFTGVTVATAPTKGAATVNGETITYTPATGFSGSDSFTYRINNPFGASNPIPVTVTVNPAPLTAPPITVEILAGQKAVVNLVAGASGRPFIGAAVVAVTPAGSGAAVVTNPSSGAYTLTFTPDNAFAGTAVVTYTLSNAFATSAPGRINVIVTARPDPSLDPEVKGLIAAQDAAAVRFADAQVSNFNRRLEQLHNGGGAGRGFGVSVRGGNVERDDGLEARERFRKYASLGMNDAADPSSPLLPAAQEGYSAKDDGEDGQAGPKRWGVWAAGSADFGMRDAVGSQSGFRFTTDGLTAGVDYRVNSDFAFGLGVGYGRDSSRVGKSGTKSRAESYSAGLYASLKTGEKTFLDGVIGYGTLNFDTRRYVTTTGELVNGERDGDQVFAALTFGMEQRTPTSLLSPYGRFAFSRSQLDAFSEVGGGPYGLTYHAQTVNSLTGTLGLRGEFIRKTAAGLLAPRFRVEYSHDFEKANDALLNYTDWVGGPTYRLTVDPIDRNQLRLELGADLTIKNGIRFGLDFDNMVTKDSDSQGVRLSIQSPF